MQAIEIIRKKRDKSCLSKQEIDFLVNSYVDGLVADYQMAAFLMATCINGMDEKEISYLTDAMLYSGEVIKHPKDGVMFIDKHSTGGVGDKISIPLAPAVAACGLRVPMIAGRGLGHTGGTLDKLEAIPGFRCDLSTEAYRQQVMAIGCVIMGQTKDIAPADKKLYALRDVTGTVESIPLIASSIMSKKLAEGIDGLVLDVKFGSGAFMSELLNAKKLASTMVAIGAHMGKKVTARLTSMDQPLGRMVGNSLEILESIEILKGQGPEDSALLTIELGAEMLLLGKVAETIEEGRLKMADSLSSGRAMEKFLAMVKAQGGDEKVIVDPSRLALAPQKIDIKALEQGVVERIDSRDIGLAVGMLGGGRFQLTDVINHHVGLEMRVKIGDVVEVGQPLCTLHADQKGVGEAVALITNAIHFVNHKVEKPNLCFDRISNN